VPISILESLVVALPPILSPSSRTFVELTLITEGHPKRVEQDSQRTSSDDIPSKKKKKKKKHKTTAESSEAGKDPNSVSIFDAETKPGDASDKEEDEEEVEEEPEKIDKNAKYTKEDFIATKHGKERENLGFTNQCLFLVKNISPRKKNTTTGFVNG
jgi:hypothetical protein